jgi:SNF2 family DNA or RNA helicase
LKEKIDVLMEIVSKKNAKILIFADFQKTFDKIKYKLEHEKISYDILKGSEKTMENIINNFKQGKTKILMLNATNFGAGLNLQEATDVIIYHRFTKETEEQVIGRAQRLGRKDTLNVYYLIHDNEENSFDDIIPFDDINYDEYLAQLE